MYTQNTVEIFQVELALKNQDAQKGRPRRS